MKTIFRALALAGGVLGLAWCMGSHQEEAKADTPEAFAATADLQITAPPTAPTAFADNDPVPVQPPAVKGDVIVAGVNTNAVGATNAAATTNVDGKIPANLIAGPTLPDAVKLSQPLNDVVKLIHAGVSEQVLMAFIAGASEPFDAGSAEIIYLHDLGVSATVITALLQHDSMPAMQARKQSNNAVQPLPPGVALTSPATNIYTPKESFDSTPNPPEPQPANQPSDSTSTQPVETTEPVPIYDTSPAVTAVSYNYWYPSLAPYGSWVTVGGCGPCWRPTVSVCNAAWRPYADCGRWLWTDCGWYWYSDYSWGWGPFHYGRWFCPPGVGWVWAPGNCWSPAWVSWRYTPSYCGWAPLPPAACYRPRSGFYFNTAAVGVGCEFGLSASAYVFVPFNRFCDRRPYNYYVTGGHAQTIYNDSTVINNYVVGNNNTIVNRGVGFDRVAQATRGGIRQVGVRDTADFGNLSLRHEQLARDGTTLAVHRPDSTSITRRGAVAPTSLPGSTMAAFHVRNERGTPTGANLVSGPPPSGPGRPVSGSDQARVTPRFGGGNNPPDQTAHRSESIFMSRPNTPAPVTARPTGTGTDRSTSYHLRNPDGSNLTGNNGSSAIRNSARPSPPPIIMRNPNPNRSTANRPVTYPFVPAAPQARADLANPSVSRPSFVPGPPSGSTRTGVNSPAPSGAPSLSYARPSVSSAPASRAEVSRPAVSAPSHSQASTRSSSQGVQASSRSSAVTTSSGRR
jgi:hypothetical protein